MKLLLFVFILFLSAQNYLPCYANVGLDSIGVTSRSGNNFILHKVIAGETLYSISRKYTVSVQSIKEANTGITDNLKLGQTLLIPMANEQAANGSKTHVVKQSETLFSISRQYNASVADIRKWNSLTDDNLSVGQKLVIKTSGTETTRVTQSETGLTVSPAASGRTTHRVAASQTLYSISRMYNVSTEDIIAWNTLDGSSLGIGQTLIVSAPSTTGTQTQQTNSSMLPPASAPTTTKDSPASPSNEVITSKPLPAETTEEIEEAGEKIIQKGMAELVKDPTDTKKYLALHREAPIGTIMQVRNEMNNQTVFVRIVGSIPPTGDNSKVMLQISKKAFDRLGAVDSRFPVEVSYLP
ncbi:MAG: LysM peptidoglycan-binding domain-containing protein [Cyclobacteriaceae bacterium]|nr:LysM peptidoglycan-binding domain-containing protein [Cyclobacteriaceae bacterium]